MRFVIVTGLSGAGKSQAIRSLEDLGYFCVDNLPPTLMGKFAEACYQTDGKINKIALVIDIRGGEFFNDLFENLKYLKEQNYRYEILFLDASDKVLVKRYKESRRTHPLAPGGRIIQGIELERRRLNEVKYKANNIIDTSNMTQMQLREKIWRIYGDDEQIQNRLIIDVLSFGFKYGIPVDADLVFDVRFLPNPYYIPELKKFSGDDKEIQDYVLGFKETKEFINKLDDMLEFLIPNYIKEGKIQLVIAIGCTGGRHRSVTIANAIYDKLKEKGHKASKEHRDINEDIKKGGRKL
ncbi:RNase adapter RapZ [Clostridium botulinum]|uniref:GlmZ(SRNA)-inactivating NTPase n=1 Tax=Clostridium botulinum C/D str. DC5 TaxID=1443128 RepID=A0A0A0IG21_CLOBO|nr:RNase adapter RapZ [Clostridium botulinum]KEI06922.1 glmZ(sRNA)-inactivating NTPase [Clostridium botulinum C/D str. BKT75002]KEI08218.1 glmZ(sRNA)-inactivating NTPase [Clostridium botulinum C/D str. BKT2873]KGM95743.1 glmZ(sRNA)-inactivating NTPase [Clostridium botulinum D str. CCUG 7971]KGN00415.1 glmZ(sRNA)-inactivating NTPase [Clostridium botulinum C/D str. DC5]KOC48010.1 glmZ(sRNA)-inactivating NTPase [Clostridium botulinum]